jgi:predicted alpha/beta superfamily hydrolase
VRHRISAAYPTTGENVLYGYSYGGNFCLYALFSDPSAFQKYICASPSLVYGGDALLAQEERWALTHSDLAAQVFLSAGEAEIVNGPVGVVSGTVRMAEALSLRRYPSLRLHVRIIPEASHDGAGRVFALTQGLHALLPAAPPAIYRAPAVD